MNDVDLAFERFVAANPIDDPMRLVADDALEVEVGTLAQRGVSRRPLARQRAWLAVAVFSLIVTSAGLLFAARSDQDVSGGAGPVEVVDAFFARWNARDPDAAMALVDLEVLVNGGLQGWSDLRALMLWSMEFDGRMETTCMPVADDPTLVTCDWAFVTAATEALSIVGAEGRPIAVDEGRIVAVSTPTYGAFERALADFARSTDPAGFATECAPDGSVASSVHGFPFTTRCGRYLAALEGQMVASPEP